MIELKPIMGGGYWAQGPDTTGNEGECELTSEKFNQFLMSEVGLEALNFWNQSEAVLNL